MNEDRKDINEFDELFHEHNIKPNIEIHKSSTPYFLAIMYYLLVMLVLSTIIGVVFLSVPSFRVSIDQNELAIQSVVSDASGLVLLPESIYEEYTNLYSGYINKIGIYYDFDPLDPNGYAVLINAENYEGVNLLTDSENNFDSAMLSEILAGTQKTWNTLGNYDIVIYESSLFPLPLTNTTADIILISESTTDLSGMSYALWNFIVYLALTPVLVFALFRQEITADLLVYKKKWNEFIPAILIGYALVLAGNFFANFVSMQISSLLGVMPSTAANQLSIEQTLQSSGMALMFISAVFLGPIAEELVFRRSIFSLLKNEKVALVISAFAFGGVHLLSESSWTGVLINGVVYIILGFVFGFIYIRNKKNIGVVIAVHMLSNLVSVISAILLF